MGGKRDKEEKSEEQRCEGKRKEGAVHSGFLPGKEVDRKSVV